MSIHYLYVPWDFWTAGKDFSQDSPRLKWKGVTRRRTLWKNTRGQELAFTDSAAEVVIYVRGHGSAGSDSVSKFSDRAGVRAGPKDVYNGLAANGLKTDFAGKIKFYNCQSGEGGE